MAAAVPRQGERALDRGRSAAEKVCIHDMSFPHASVDVNGCQGDKDEPSERGFGGEEERRRGQREEAESRGGCAMGGYVPVHPDHLHPLTVPL